MPGLAANGLHIGDANDVHSYPWPADPKPSATQYAMIGEFGGIGAFIQGKEWANCHTYLPAKTAGGAVGMICNVWYMYTFWLHILRYGHTNPSRSTVCV